MVKIFGFIGSPLKENSNTYTITKMMLDILVETDENIEYELITARDVQINQCTGCWSCIKTGKCPQDKLEDMASLKQKMVDADFIIWGSPVYAMQVSGQMKIFLDRLSGWYHLMNLAGKSGMTVATTAGSGLKDVHKYLGLVFSALGVKVVASLGTYGTFPKPLIDPEEVITEVLETAEKVYPYLTGEKQVETDKHLEQCFQTRKRIITAGARWFPGHYTYWKEKGMLELNSFAELLEKRKFSKTHAPPMSVILKLKISIDKNSENFDTFAISDCDVCEVELHNREK